MDDNERREEQDFAYPDKIIRSNTLINSKYSSTLIENQLLAMCLKNAKKDEFYTQIEDINRKSEKCAKIL